MFKFWAFKFVSTTILIIILSLSVASQSVSTYDYIAERTYQIKIYQDDEVIATGNGIFTPVLRDTLFITADHVVNKNNVDPTSSFNIALNHNYTNQGKALWQFEVKSMNELSPFITRDTLNDVAAINITELDSYLTDKNKINCCTQKINLIDIYKNSNKRSAPDQEVAVSSVPFSLYIERSNVANNLKPLFRRGIISSNYPDEIILQLPAFHGDSGTPVFSIDGENIEFIGIIIQIALTVGSNSGMSIAIKREVVQRLLPKS